MNAGIMAGLGSGACRFACVRNNSRRSMPRIGFLQQQRRQMKREYSSRSFGEGLAELGYVQGRNLTIEHLWADGTL